MRPIDGSVWLSEKGALNVGVMDNEVRGKAVIIDIIDIGATVDFPPLASPLCGPFQRANGKEPGSCR